jgi:hypothetical protein
MSKETDSAKRRAHRGGALARAVFERGNSAELL